MTDQFFPHPAAGSDKIDGSSGGWCGSAVSYSYLLISYTMEFKPVISRLGEIDEELRVAIVRMINALAAMPPIQRDFLPSINALRGLIDEMTRSKMTVDSDDE